MALSLPRRVVVVAASMGGSYGLAFVISPGAFEVAGYVTAAGVLSALPKSGARVATPTLAIRGVQRQFSIWEKLEFGEAWVLYWCRV